MPYFIPYICSLIFNKGNMYPEYLVAPMRKELTDVGFEELTTPEEVDAAVNSAGSVLVVVNSVCGCAASNARPAAKVAIQNEKHPEKIVTVFAGMAKDAVDKDRKSTRLNSSHYCASRMPSS